MTRPENKPSALSFEVKAYFVYKNYTVVAVNSD